MQKNCGRKGCRAVREPSPSRKPQKEENMAGKRQRPLPGRTIRIGVSLAAAACVFLLTFYSAFSIWDAQFTDRIYQSESVGVLPVTIVCIDEATLDAYGQPSTWSRQMYADLINALNADEARPAVIAFDMLFTGYKDAEGDAAFAEAAKSSGNVVAGSRVSYSEHGNGRERLSDDTLHHIDSVVLPYKELNDVVSVGLTDCETDHYDFVTMAVTGLSYNGQWNDCFAVAVLKQFQSYVESNPSYAAMHPEYAGFTVPDYSKDTRVKKRFSYTCKPGDFDRVSFKDLIEGNVSGKNYANNIVIVGAYAPGLQDDFRIAFASGDSKMYGVEIHANIMEAVYGNRFQVDADKTVLAVIYGLVSGLLCFALFHLGIVKGILLCAGAAVVHVVSSIVFYKNGLYIPLLYMLAACILLIIGGIVYHYLSARAERQKINRAFRMYVAPEIVDDVAGSGTYELQLGGRHKDIAVLFVDIRGFTTMSENLAPEEVVDILNEYFGVITDAIFKNKGTLDKFIGDAAMAVFNSPFDLDDYVYRAVMTACDIAKASEALGEKLMERFGKKVSYGIGVNCGEAIIGNIGSSFRMDYTAIGDTVNTASRLESNAKAGEILISEEVKKRLEGRIETEDVGEIPLKGKSRKIFVYRVKL